MLRHFATINDRFVPSPFCRPLLVFFAENHLFWLAFFVCVGQQALLSHFACYLSSWMVAILDNVTTIQLKSPILHSELTERGMEYHGRWEYNDPGLGLPQSPSSRDEMSHPWFPAPTLSAAVGIEPQSLRCCRKVQLVLGQPP